ncbi:MAG TPA: hypothetical protein VLV49_15070 [Terriglobales bacterium]|nr:hypothetical protein [Terriglobales bacterium]
MIERFILPDAASTAEQPINVVSGPALDSAHDIGQAAGPILCIQQGGEDEMNVIGHDNGGMQVNSPAILLKTAI